MQRYPLWRQVDNLETVLELCAFVEALLQGLASASEERWRTKRVWLLLQLLCACQRCLSLRGDCRPLLNLMEQLVPTCQQVWHHRLFFSLLLLLLLLLFTCIVLRRSCHWKSCWWAWPCSCLRPPQLSRTACSDLVNNGALTQSLNMFSVFFARLSFAKSTYIEERVEYLCRIDTFKWAFSQLSLPVNVHCIFSVLTAFEDLKSVIYLKKGSKVHMWCAPEQS